VQSTVHNADQRVASLLIRGNSSPNRWDYRLNTPAAGGSECNRSFSQLEELRALDFDITIVNTVTTISVIVNK